MGGQDDNACGQLEASEECHVKNICARGVVWKGRANVHLGMGRQDDKGQGQRKALHFTLKLSSVHRPPPFPPSALLCFPPSSLDTLTVSPDPCASPTRRAWCRVAQRVASRKAHVLRQARAAASAAAAGPVARRRAARAIFAHAGRAASSPSRRGREQGRRRRRRGGGLPGRPGGRADRHAAAQPAAGAGYQRGSCAAEHQAHRGGVGLRRAQPGGQASGRMRGCGRGWGRNFAMFI
eukprot:364007-Chlamydomonas_euryale.AAC.3